MQNKWKRLNREFIYRVEEVTKLPVVEVTDIPVIYQLGDKEIQIEHYHRLLEYEEEQIRLSTSIGTIRIAGKKLNIAYFSQTKMVIRGTIISFSVSADVSR